MIRRSVTLVASGVLTVMAVQLAVVAAQSARDVGVALVFLGLSGLAATSAIDLFQSVYNRKVV